jgi:hypothetical protein
MDDLKKQVSLLLFVLDSLQVLTSIPLQLAEKSTELQTAKYKLSDMEMRANELADTVEHLKETQSELEGIQPVPLGPYQ